MRRRTLLVSAALLGLALPPLPTLRVRGVIALLFLQHAHRLAEVVLPELRLFIDDKIYTLSTSWEEIML